MARHKRHEEHEEHASEAWLVAFADMMTLLMVTFLMMFAISALDLQKFKTFQEAFKEGLGSNTHQLPAEGAPPEGTPRDVPLGSKEGTPNPTPKPVPPVTGPNPPAQATAGTTEKVLQREDLAKLKAQLEQAVAIAGLQSEVQVAMDPRGLVLYVTSGVLFDAGRADLTPQGSQLLAGLVPALAGIGNELVVEGHTDSRPISTPAFPSNWELSTARATAVLRSLEERGGLAAGRLSAAGYADTRPRVPGTDPAALARNRRVDIVVNAPAPAPAETAAAAPAAAPAADHAAPAAPAASAAPAHGAAGH